jgi:hypothetical protein
MPDELLKKIDNLLTINQNIALHIQKLEEQKNKNIIQCNMNLREIAYYLLNKHNDDTLIRSISVAKDGDMFDVNIMNLKNPEKNKNEENIEIPDNKDNNENIIDKILDKINKKGIESLTEEEKNILKNENKK